MERRLQCARRFELYLMERRLQWKARDEVDSVAWV
ncbi:hypothetical protein OROHE_020538 [Orobanche hederae]